MGISNLISGSSQGFANLPMSLCEVYFGVKKSGLCLRSTCLPGVEDSGLSALYQVHSTAWLLNAHHYSALEF